MVSGEFTHVVQRVPVRIQIERDDRWQQLPRRAVRDRGNRSWSWRRRLGGGCVPGDEGARDAIQRHGEAREPAIDGNGSTAGRDHDNACRFCPKPDRRPVADHARAPALAGRPGHALCSFAPYQTLVQTVIIDDEIRLGVEVDSYDMIWVNVAYLVGFIYGLFAGTVCQFGSANAIHSSSRLLLFCVGNVLCGAATGLFSLAFGRFVEGFGKLMLWLSAAPRFTNSSTVPLLVAIGFYGVFAYSTRYWTPLINAYIDVYFSWRWTYWAYVPVSLIATVLVLCFFRPDRPPQPVRLRLDWLAITGFVAWIIAIDFAFSWYRRWGGWSSNAFVGASPFAWPYRWLWQPGWGRA